MSFKFSGSEILTMAVELEKEGMQFYEEMAKVLKNREHKQICKRLAEDEKKHADIFQKLGSEGGFSSPAYEDQEAIEYLKALIEMKVFKEKGAMDIRELINKGIEAEKDSLLFYYEIIQNVSDDESRFIKKIIKEEQSHLKQLIELQTQMIL